MSDEVHEVQETKAEAQIRTGSKTTEFLVTLAQLAFAAYALWLGKDEVAMVALAAAGLYPLSRSMVKR